MDERILPVLRCPVAQQPLALTVLESAEVGGRRLVKTGILSCPASRLWYPVVNFVPVLLTFPTPLAQSFARRHADALAKLPGFAAPALAPMPGEASVQRTFTEEWGGLGDDVLTFVYTDDELVTLHRDVWLRMAPAEIAARTRVVNVGCGFGKESVVLARIFPEADVFAVDLNLALIAAGPGLAAQARVHPVVASLFRLPFAPASVDHVHSQGVLHHTFSTRKAFDSIAALVAPTGSLFVWLYAAEDAHVVPGFRGFLIWLYWVVSHRIGRPILSRAPAWFRNGCLYALTAVMHPLIKARSRHRESWGFRNSLHGLRDAFTPRYAHQHGFNEVIEWFEELDFEPQIQSPRRYRALTGARMLGVGVLGRRRG